MDIVINIFRYLSSSFTPTEFVGLLAVIISISYLIIKYVLKNVKNNNGFWAFLDTDEHVVELKDVNDILELFKEEALTKLNVILESQQKVIAHLNETREEDRVRSESLLGYIEEIKDLGDFLSEAKKNIDKEFNDIKHNIKMNDLHGHESFENIKQSIKNTIDVISKANAQIEKIDEYVKNAVPEFKMAHRDLSKDISNLGKDIAIIERSLQNQINSSIGLKLK